MKTRTTTIAVALATLSIPCMGVAEAGATTKTDRAQNKLIKKLTHDLKVVSAREKQDQANFVALVSCIGTYDLTWYGDTLNTNTDGYTYVPVSGVPFQFTAMAPTYAGDLPSASFLTLDCTGSSRVNRRVFKSDLFSPSAKGHTVAPHRS